MTRLLPETAVSMYLESPLLAHQYSRARIRNRSMWLVISGGVDAMMLLAEATHQHGCEWDPKETVEDLLAELAAEEKEYS